MVGHTITDMERREKYPTIETVQGTAVYLRTEVEDVFGDWQDGYDTKMGDWVVHEGLMHHVYRNPYGKAQVIGEERLMLRRGK